MSESSSNTENSINDIEEIDVFKKDFLPRAYNRFEDKILYRTIVFGGLILIGVVVIGLFLCAFLEKDVPDNMTALPTTIFGFITGIFLGKHMSEDDS